MNRRDRLRLLADLERERFVEPPRACEALTTGQLADLRLIVALVAQATGGKR